MAALGIIGVGALAEFVLRGLRRAGDAARGGSDSLIDLNSVGSSGTPPLPTLDTFLPLLGFVVIATCTPGPNNVMVLASGANWGLRRTLPHILGIAVGFPVMIIAAGLGLGFVFDQYPIVHTVLKYVSFAYLLWLALQIARSAGMAGAAARGKPMTFLQACAFQWINPKAWMTAVGAISAYTAGRGAQLYWQVTILALICLVVAVPATFIWASFGAAIRKWLRAPKALQAFNTVMALLLVASVVPILIEIGEALRGQMPPPSVRWMPHSSLSRPDQRPAR